MDWKIGDIAICIDVKPRQGFTIDALRLNAEYIVQNIGKCGCGSVELDIGMVHNPEDKLHCCCGRSVLGETIRWFKASRFTKKKSKEEQMEEALKKEDYETCAQLNYEMTKERKIKIIEQ